MCDSAGVSSNKVLIENNEAFGDIESKHLNLIFMMNGLAKIRRSRY
jgi:hypothetical protein